MICVGDVFFLRCKNCNPPKDKFFVVALVDPLKLFLINSKMTSFQKARPEFVVAQVTITVDEHDFLDHDSLIACDWLHHEYDLASLEAAVACNQKYRFVGNLSIAARQGVAAALQGNVHIQGKWLKLLKQCWP